MKKRIITSAFLGLAIGLGNVYASPFAPNVYDDGSDVICLSPARANQAGATDRMTIDGTGATGRLTVSTASLTQDVKVTVTHGFSVSPATIPAGTKSAEIVVTNLSNLASNTGKLILRSGDVRYYVELTGLGDPLETKSLSENPIYAGGTDVEKTYTEFAPGANGYTVEFRVKTDDAAKNFYPFAVSDKGVGFKSYIGSTKMGMYNSGTKKDGLRNPSNGGTFYNTDGKFHTYRFAVAADKHIFVYRDGIAIDTLRSSDYGLQHEWAVENGDLVENLLKNPGFEGDWTFDNSRNIVTYIEGWDVLPFDQYNSVQEIVNEEMSNDKDQDNHILSIDRYMWSDGWSAAEIAQIVDVAPNEMYSFSALARGGLKSDGTQLGSLRIQDLQNADNKVVIPVTSETFEKYAADFETKANTKQIRVFCYLERDKWGASISNLKVDDVKLTGTSRAVKPQIGFTNEGSDIAYFNFDVTGAYSPAFPVLTAEEIQTAINSTEEEESNISAKVSNGMLILDNVAENSFVRVYNTDAKLIATVPNYVSDTGIALPARGMYIVLVVNENKRNTVKVLY